MALDQDGDVARCQRALADADPVGRRFAEQSRHFGGGGAPRRLLGLAARQVLTINGGQLPDAQGRGLCLASVGKRLARLVAGAHRLVVEAGEDEGVGIYGEQRVAGSDQAGGRALVVAQGGRRIDLPPGGQVGVQVGVAKAVDRLLGIADQEQRRRRPLGAGAINAVENCVLQRVGVLEFVNQRHRIALAQGASQPGRIARSQGGVDVVQHVIEGQHALPALGLSHGGAGFGEQAAQQAQARHLQRLCHGRVHGQQLIGGVEEGVGGWRLLLLGPGGDAATGE